MPTHSLSSVRKRDAAFDSPFPSAMKIEDLSQSSSLFENENRQLCLVIHSTDNKSLQDPRKQVNADITRLDAKDVSEIKTFNAGNNIGE